MTDISKTTVGSAPLPAPLHPGDESRWKYFDRYWFLLIGAVALAILLYVAFPERYGVILRFVIGSYGEGDGIFLTLKLTIVSFLFIVCVGMIMGVFRVANSPLLRGLSSIYVEIVRGVPVLVWLLWLYYGIPILFREIPALSTIKIRDFTAAVIAFTFAYGAYMTEVFRAGIQSIAKGQMEASRSLGMNYVQAMRYVILPQAVRVILPPMSNEFVTLLKDSALVSILGLPDLTRRGREFVGRTFQSFDTYLIVALLYLILTVLFTRLATSLERRMAVERR
ncbi:MAG: putative amino-acid permease protein YxeN [Chloroflexi bacterium ADurb.Bin325]|nr:MAG: putative amino-acid permease protein YxeN [Chloroflexi bacterium ADurb.Bin325]